MKTLSTRIISELPVISWTELKGYEFNELKELKNRNVSNLKNSLVNEGFAFPFFIWQRYVLDGTGRYIAIQELEVEGYTIPDLPYIELKADNLQAAKKLALMASSKHGQITQKSFEDFISDLDIDDLSMDINIPEIKLDIAGISLDSEEELEEPSSNEESIEYQTITKEGDIWELNEHRILCGNATKKENFQSLMNGEIADMIFIDPPYNLKVSSFCGSGNTNHKEFKQASGEMSRQEFIRFLKEVFQNLVSISKDGSIHYICMDWRHVVEIMAAGEDCYTELKNLCIWSKDTPGQGSFYRSQHELIFIWKNGKEKHINNFELGQFGRTRSNIWTYPSAMSFANQDREREGNKILGKGEFANHPTPKPVNMVADCCLDCSNLSSIVVDVFLGSGTSLIAAEKTNRKFYGMELEPSYIDSSIRRWINYMNKEDKDYIVKRNGEIVDLEESRPAFIGK